MKKTDFIRRFIYALSLLVALTGPVFIWVAGAETVIVLLCGLGFILLLAMVVLMDALHRAYTDKLLIDLSNLVDSIINMRESSIFSDVEDTLLSKLQTQVVKLSGILKAQNKAIRSEKDEIKSLISDIAHQIKTPVASVKMFGDLLQEPGLSEEQRHEYLKMLGQSLDKLAFLTDSMVKMSRLESGIIMLNPQPSDLNDILLHVVKQAYHKAKEKNIEISFDGAGDITLILDKNWTVEAIFNILDNAVKYTPDGGTVAISVVKYELFVRVDIADNGMGIPEHEQARIFTRFYRGQGAADVEGVGLGLYLSRKIITDQGGYIKVDSNENGSVFSVFLYHNSKKL